MIERRHFAGVAAIGVLILALAGFLAWKAWSGGEGGSLSEPIAVNATIGPQQHMFGDPIRARVELILDSKRIDPDTVKVHANFAPYRPLRQPTRVETSSGSITRLRFDYPLSCLGYRCLPIGLRRFDLHNASVEYRTRSGQTGRTEAIDWPTLEVAGRIPASRMWAAKLQGSEYRDLGPPTYRISPTLVQVVALVLAVLFAAGALVLILRLLPLARIAERLGLKTVDRRTSLERALAQVEETADAEPDEGRRALERLAHELRRVRSPELAGAASRLAWSRDYPADGRLTSLSAEVKRLIKEGAGA
ncbi:MAG TPA: hypothetical protein VKB13_00205 [Gaiellaceae bacterium]|nr:hypothetical protein [Gaiellaceae bacterium]